MDFRWSASKQLAKLYFLVYEIPWVGDIVADGLLGICNWVVPAEVPKGYLNPTMAEVIAEDLGISVEDLADIIKTGRRNFERGQLGLPPT